jgi:hypothetical protein
MEIDTTTDTFYDDSSGSLNLGHGQGSAGGGINRYFEGEISDRQQREEEAQRRRRDTERAVLEHNREVERTGSGEKWAAPSEDYSNAEAYESVEARTQELQRTGLSLLEATQIARAEIDGGREPDAATALARSRDYLGDAPENLMKYDGEVDGGSSKSGKMKREKKPGGPEFPAVLASYWIEPEPRSERFYGRMSKTTAAALDEFEDRTGINAAGVIAGVAQLAQSEDPRDRDALKRLEGAVPIRVTKARAS